MGKGEIARDNNILSDNNIFVLTVTFQHVTLIRRTTIFLSAQ